MWGKKSYQPACLADFFELPLTQSCVFEAVQYIFALLMLLFSGTIQFFLVIDFYFIFHVYIIVRLYVKYIYVHTYLSVCQED